MRSTPIGNVDPDGLDTLENEDRMMNRYPTPTPMRGSRPAEPARPSPSISDVGGAVAQAGELLGDLASKAGDREQLTYFNYAIDANHDRLITSDESMFRARNSFAEIVLPVG